MSAPLLPVMRALVLALPLALAACGGDPPPADPDAAPPPDGPPDVTFTSYVLDLVLNQTAATTEPRPFDEFANLADVDRDNPFAYEALFP